MARERALSDGLGRLCSVVQATNPAHDLRLSGLLPQGSRADQILLTAAAAPSLDAHQHSTPNVNPIYTQMRDAAWARLRCGEAPDSRLLANLDRVEFIARRAAASCGRFRPHKG